MTSLAYTMTPNMISIVLDNRMRSVASGNLNFNALRETLKAYGKAKMEGASLSSFVDAIRSLVDTPSFVAKQSFGRVQIGVAPAGSYEVRFDGDAVHTVIAERLLDFLTEGFDIEPLARFLDKLMENPSEVARNELYLWIESGNFVITSDGDFLAFKNVRSDYKDIHSGRFDNSVGQTLQMDRKLVDADRHRTCSAGLHFCSHSYLPHFSHSAGGHTMIVKINPADVVAIPSDYNNAKGRTWRYVVVGEMPEGQDAATVFGNVEINDSYNPNDPSIVDADPDDDNDDYLNYGDDYGDDSDDGATAIKFTTSDGRTFTVEQVLDAVENSGGQRAGARSLGVARSTLWGWLQKIEAAA